MTACSQTLTSRSSVRLMAASRRTAEAPPRPSSRRGRISERFTHPKLTTVPLKSRPNASPFWIMLLLSSTAFENGMMDADRTREAEHQTTNLGVRSSNLFGRARINLKFNELTKQPPQRRKLVNSCKHNVSSRVIQRHV